MCPADQPAVSPLPPKAASLQQTLSSLHTTISPLDIQTPASLPQMTGTGGHTKAWDLGRQAYLNWAVGKMVSASGGASDVPGGDKMEGLEEVMVGMRGGEGMEKLAKAAGA